MEDSNLKIVFCGILKSPFIAKDLEILKQYYTITVINLDIVNDKREGIFYFLWSLLTKYINIIKNSDIVYIWFAELPALPLILFSNIFKKKSILLIGGGEVVNYPEIHYGNQGNFIRGFVTRWCLKNASVVIVCSNAYKDIVKELEVTSNVYVVPMAIDKSLCDYPLPIKSDKIGRAHV
jgi:hypothetical protein